MLDLELPFLCHEHGAFITRLPLHNNLHCGFDKVTNATDRLIHAIAKESTMLNLV